MKPRIVISAVNLDKMGALSVLQEVLAFLAEQYSETYEIVALVHRKELIKIDGIAYREYPEVKRKWINRLRFEYLQASRIARDLQPALWLSMSDITPNVKVERLAVYCQNAAPMYKFHWRDLRFDWKFGAFSLLYKYLYLINIRRNDYVIVQQDWIRDWFKRELSVSNVIVAYPDLTQNPPASPSVPAAGSAPRPFRFFYPSFPRTHKNFQVVLEAARILEKSGCCDCEVWLTFEAANNRFASQLVREFRSLKSVRFLGLLKRAEVYDCYARCDCLLFAGKVESWGMPITEFQGYGKPMLLADLPYAHETAGNCSNAAFFAPDDPQALAKLMIEAMRGTLVCAPVCNKAPAAPFARGWRSLFEILLAGGSTTAESERRALAGRRE